MENITKQKRDQMISFLEELKKEQSDDASVRAFNEIENHLTEKKFGLVFEGADIPINTLDTRRCISYRIGLWKSSIMKSREMIENLGKLFLEEFIKWLSIQKMEISKNMIL